jgi:hypothetical protein
MSFNVPVFHPIFLFLRLTISFFPTCISPWPRTSKCPEHPLLTVRFRSVALSSLASRI